MKWAPGAGLILSHDSKHTKKWIYNTTTWFQYAIANEHANLNPTGTNQWLLPNSTLIHLIIVLKAHVKSWLYLSWILTINCAVQAHEWLYTIVHVSNVTTVVVPMNHHNQCVYCKYTNSFIQWCSLASVNWGATHSMKHLYILILVPSWGVGSELAGLAGSRNRSPPLAGRSHWLLAAVMWYVCWVYAHDSLAARTPLWVRISQGVLWW